MDRTVDDALAEAGAGSFQLRLLAIFGMVWAADAMQVVAVGFAAPSIGRHFGVEMPVALQTGTLFFLGMSVGAYLFGRLADRIGRRQVFAITLLIYGAATGASALVGGLALLLVLRFIVGLGLGAELPVASTYVSEFAPARIRGRVIVILEAFWAVGWTASAIIGYFVVPASENGWRWAFFIGAVPAIYALVVRLGLPESPRWLASRGRTTEALRIVETFEASARAGAGPRTEEAAPATDASGAQASGAAIRARATTSRRPLDDSQAFSSAATRAGCRCPKFTAE